MFVYLLDVVFFWEGVGNALLQFALVGIVIEQYGIGFLSVAPSASCLLKIRFDAVRTVHVDDQSYVRLIDTHAKSVGGYHHACLVFLPSHLALVFYYRVESGMVEGGRNACFVEQLCNFLGASTTAGIDNGRTFHTVKDVDEFLALIGSASYNVSQIFAFEGHAKNVKAMFHLPR